jgi:2-succinyl-5-enolpyruvyl-6-hydroxy-3-cyclohexene-1-carboxylate synthase
MASAARLAAGLAQRGLGGIVFSPGSRNAPLIQAFSPLGLPSAVALDERSAAHHALGMAQALGQPVAVSCTSGTASLHHGPALAEAHRVGLPLVSLTADRPAGAHDEWQSQTMVQAGIHATHVRADFTWDCPSDAAAVGLLDDMASAWAHGPIHVNCPFDTPLYPDAAHPQAASGTPETAAPLASRPADNGDATVLIERLGQAIQKSERILLLGGTQPAPLNPIDLRAWAKCAVLAGDSTSGMALDGLPVITACDRWLAAWEASGRRKTRPHRHFWCATALAQAARGAGPRRPGPLPHRRRRRCTASIR